MSHVWVLTLCACHISAIYETVGGLHPMSNDLCHMCQLSFVLFVFFSPIAEQVINVEEYDSDIGTLVGDVRYLFHYLNKSLTSYCFSTVLTCS